MNEAAPQAVPQLRTLAVTVRIGEGEWHRPGSLGAGGAR